jgi:hypothetical protein
MSHSACQMGPTASYWFRGCWGAAIPCAESFIFIPTDLLGCEGTAIAASSHLAVLSCSTAVGGAGLPEVLERSRLLRQCRTTGKPGAWLHPRCAGAGCRRWGAKFRRRCVDQECFRAGGDAAPRKDAKNSQINESEFVHDCACQPWSSQRSS